MKVLILGSYPVYPFADELGIDVKTVTRITSWNEILAKELAKLPDTTVYIITGTTAITIPITVSNRYLKVTYIPVQKWKNRLTFFQYLRYKAMKYINDYNPDIVHGIGTEHIWPYVALHSHYPTVVTVHGIISEIVKKSPPKLFSQQRFFAWLEPRVLRDTRHLISINPYVTDTLGKYTSAKCYSIENPIRDIFFEAVATPSDNDYILFVGSITHGKGVHDLLDALNIIKMQEGMLKIQLILAGPILNKAYGDQLNLTIEKFNLQKEVVFAGFKMPCELVEMYSKAALLALPSYAETAPMCIAEAMSVGIPVVATNVGGVRYMVKQGETGYIVEPGDVSALQSKIHHLTSNPELCNKMGRYAKKIAKTRWLPETIAKQTRNIYQEVIKKS